MQNASSAGRKLTNEERVELVKRQKRQQLQLAMLSVIGILGFLYFSGRQLFWRVFCPAATSRRLRRLSHRLLQSWWILIRTARCWGFIDGQPPGGPDGFFCWQLSLEFLWGFLWLVPGIRQIYAAHLLKFCGPYRRFPDSADHHLDGNRPAGRRHLIVFFSAFVPVILSMHIPALSSPARC